MPLPSHRLRSLPLAVAVVGFLGLGACGDDADGAGPAIVADAGCAACHGVDGEGGIGPAWVGLYGSTVTLEDGSVVVADDAYLTRAITDPDVERVAGFPIKMPANDLSPEQVAELVAYLRQLGGPGSPSTSSAGS